MQGAGCAAWSFPASGRQRSRCRLGGITNPTYPLRVQRSSAPAGAARLFELLFLGSLMRIGGGWCPAAPPPQIGKNIETPGELNEKIAGYGQGRSEDQITDQESLAQAHHP